MTARSPFTFPGDRTFAGWWKQFAPLQPLRVLAGHFLVQEVEVLVRRPQRTELDNLSRFLLESFAEPQPSGFAQLEANPSLRSAGPYLLQELETNDWLVKSDSSGWQITALGREILELGLPADERCRYDLLDLRPTAGILAVTFPKTVQRQPWPEALAPSQGLSTSVLQPLLPEIEILPFPDSCTHPPPWQRIPLVRPWRLSVAVAIVASAEGEKAQVLPLKPDSWTVPNLEPLLILPIESIQSPTTETWHNVWREWCIARHVPENEIAATTVEKQGHRLLVRIPTRLRDRLKAARSDVFKGDTWVVAQEGMWREGVVLLLETEP